MSIYDFEVVEINGETVSLANYQGKVLLIVNTASKCGFTPQFEALEALYEKYQAQGLVILGFPCNQFLAQDPRDNQTILEFCQKNYGVTFPMHEKIKVKGKDAHPLYKYLVKETGGKNVEWNFTKFLINRDGEIVERFASKVTPADMEEKVAAALEQ